MSLNDYKRAEGFGFCTHGGGFPDDCPEKAVLSLHGHGVCFRHAFASALAGEPEAQAAAMVWATNEIERLQETKR